MSPNTIYTLDTPPARPSAEWNSLLHNSEIGTPKQSDVTLMRALASAERDLR